MSRPAGDGAAAAAQRAAALLDLGRFDEAERLLAEVIASDPENALASCLLSQALISQERFQDGLDAATRAGSLAPEEEWPHRLMSVAWAELGNAHRAVRSAEEAVRLAPHEWESQVQLTDALLGIPDLPKAASAAARAIGIAPYQPEPHLAAGIVATAEGRRGDAIAAFQEVLALDPDNSAAHDALARARLAGGRIVNANAGRLASAAGGFAAATRADPKSEASRSAVDAVLQLFLRVVAYLVGLDVLIVYYTRHASPSITHILPLVLLVVPVGYAIWFAFGLPRELRPYLFRHAFTGGKWIPTGLETAALAALVSSSWATPSSRDAFIFSAIAAGLAARIILWALVTPQARAQTPEQDD